IRSSFLSLSSLCFSSSASVRKLAGGGLRSLNFSRTIPGRASRSRWASSGRSGTPRSSEARSRGLSCPHSCPRFWRRAFSRPFFSFARDFLSRSYALFMAWWTRLAAAASFLCLAGGVSRSSGGSTPCSGAPSQDLCFFATAVRRVRLQSRERLRSCNLNHCLGAADQRLTPDAHEYFFERSRPMHS